MRFFVDENIPEPIAENLATVFFSHEFVSAYSNLARYGGIDDLDLFPRIAADGFDAVVTKDKRQLKVRAEGQCLLDNGLHWIGHQSKGHKGLVGIATMTATTVSGLVHVLDSWHEQPTAYRLRGVRAQKAQRITVTPIVMRDRPLPES